MRRALRHLVGLAVSVALLAWALRGVAVDELLRELRSVHLGWLAVATAIATAGMLTRAWRWRVLLRPMQGTPLSSCLEATVIGFALNNLLPARIGEFARALVLRQRTGVPMPAAFGTLVIERVLDGVVLLGLLVATLQAPLPAARAGDFLVLVRGMTSLLGALCLGLLVLAARPRWALALSDAIARRLPGRPRRLVEDAARAFVRSFDALRHGPTFALAALASVAQWLFLGLSYLTAFRAFGIDLPYRAALLVQSIESFFVSVPSSPGFFGPFEAAARLALAAWGVPAEKAVSFALGFHIAGFVPVTLWGLIYLWRTPLDWRRLRRAEEAVEEEIELVDATPRS
jgi:uncharacterized protein (TIRG00374 family)